jgi:hypothetical protein
MNLTCNARGVLRSVTHMLNECNACCRLRGHEEQGSSYVRYQTSECMYIYMLGRLN